MRTLFQCEQWNPLYVLMMHEAICGSATSGLTWAASTQISLVVLSLIFLTLRMACYDTTEVVEDPDYPSGGCCPCFRSKPSAGASKNKFQPASEVEVGWVDSCCGPRRPKGHIGEIHIDQPGALPGMTPRIPHRQSEPALPSESAPNKTKEDGDDDDNSSASYGEEEIPLKD